MESSGCPRCTSTPDCFQRPAVGAMDRVALVDGHFCARISTRSSLGSACNAFDRRLRSQAG